ncbi:MAG TPA: hypothetical protein VLA30_11030 [Burkholderiales bacterium]|nr:hypothetical protein [Burkholderiales bacterium]
MRSTIAVAVVLVLAMPLAPARAAEGWRFGLAGEAVHDDNATRGLLDGAKSDNIVVLEGSATRSFLLSPSSGALVRASARYSHFADIKDISNLALIGRAAWRYQAGTGFSAPWYELAGQAQLLRHADSELRDGSIVSIDASAGSHLTDRMRVAGGVGFDKRSGGGSVGLYELSTNRIWATLDLRLGARNTAYARLTREAGDHVFSSGSTSGLTAVWEDDPALREPLGLAVANTYRVDATALIVELGFNYPLSRAQALDFSLVRIDSEMDEGLLQGNSYSATQLRATYLYRFQ